MDPDPDCVLGVLAYENTYSKSFLTEISGCLTDLADTIATLRVDLGLHASERGDHVLERAAGMSGFSAAQLKTFVAFCVQRYNDKRIEPGAYDSFDFSISTRRASSTASVIAKL